MFASALAPVEPFDRERIVTALRVLGQENPDDLRCTYCGVSAETWDHLEALVRKSEPSGYGHLIGNLVPCCRACNSAKGNKPWRDWMKTREYARGQIGRVERYREEYGSATAVNWELTAPTELAQLKEIRSEILRLMVGADSLVSQMKEKVRPR